VISRLFIEKVAFSPQICVFPSYFLPTYINFPKIRLLTLISHFPLYLCGKMGCSSSEPSEPQPPKPQPKVDKLIKELHASSGLHRDEVGEMEIKCAELEAELQDILQEIQ